MFLTKKMSSFASSPSWSSSSSKRSVILVPHLESSYIQVFVEVVELASDEVLLNKVLQDLLSFCEVVSRTALIHELRITPFSLGTAVARGWSPLGVIGCLKKVVRVVAAAFSNTFAATPNRDWDPRMEVFISRCMSSFTRARLVIKNSNVHSQVTSTATPTATSTNVVVECDDRKTFDILSLDPVIRSMMKKKQQQQQHQQQQHQHNTINTGSGIGVDGESGDDLDEIVNGNSSKAEMLSFELQDIQCANHVVARSFALGLPLRRQYDFENDAELRRLHIALRPSAQPRPYQKAAVESAIVSATSPNSPSSSSSSPLLQRFSNSGVIVIPCGGGKTLVGVMCFAAIKRPTVILCVNAISVDQWKEQIEKYAYCVRQQPQHQHRASQPATFSSTIQIALWTAKKKDPITRDTDVVVTTYHALAGLVRRRQLLQITEASQKLHRHSQKGGRGGRGDGGGTGGRSSTSNTKPDNNNNNNNNNNINNIEDQEETEPSTTSNFKNNNHNSKAQQLLHHPLLRWNWGLLILDEAHVVPATYFRDGVSSISAKCTIGLTATFVREDDRIGDLQHLCGPKLFDIGWETLRDAGFLASVKCREVIVPLPSAFQSEYWNRMRSKFSLSSTDDPAGTEKTNVNNNNNNNDNHNNNNNNNKKKNNNKKQHPAALVAAPSSGRRRQRVVVEQSSSSSSDDVSVDDDLEYSASSSSSSDNDNDEADDAGNDLTPLSNKNLHPVLIALAASNPNKIFCAKKICERHRGQKILIFCDIITLLLEYANQLKCPAIYGATPHAERVRLFSDFENTSTRNILCVSRVGEISINLPSARVVIQVSSHGGSRRQEVQRLGRVLRPKNNCSDTTNGGNNSWFYSLVSADTIEVDYAARRSRFLIDQGYQADQETFDVEAALAILQQQQQQLQQHKQATTNTTNNIKIQGSPHSGDAATTVKTEAELSNNINSSTFLNKDWIFAWLVKVIARWELDFAPQLMQQAKGRGGGKNKQKQSVPLLLQQGETRQQRTAMSKWTVGAEKDAIVYDEA